MHPTSADHQQHESCLCGLIVVGSREKGHVRRPSEAAFVLCALLHSLRCVRRYCPSPASAPPPAFRLRLPHCSRAAVAGRASVPTGARGVCRSA